MTFAAPELTIPLRMTNLADRLRAAGFKPHTEWTCHQCGRPTIPESYSRCLSCQINDPPQEQTMQELQPWQKEVYDWIKNYDGERIVVPFSRRRLKPNYHKLIQEQIMSQKLEAMFRPTYRKLSQTEEDQILRIKEKALSLAIELNPTDTREKQLALTKLEEAVMWAVKGVST